MVDDRNSKANEPALPHSTTAERAVLLSVLNEPGAVHILGAMLQPDDFYDERHATIYAAALDLDGNEVNLLTVHDALEAGGRLKEAGGASYIFEVASASYYVPMWQAEQHARRIADHATRRRLIEASSIIAKSAWDNDAATATARAYAALEDAQQRNITGLVSVAESVPDLFDEVAAWGDNPLMFGEVRGLATGIPSLDNLTGGLNPGELILLAARPSVGKSALALEIARRVATTGGKVAVFELEMTRHNILLRWASCLSRVSTRQIKRGICPPQYEGKHAAAHYASRKEWANVIHELSKLNELTTIAIDDTGGITTSDIRMRSIQFASQLGGLDLVVVDHTDIIKSDQRPGENSAKTEGRKSREMHELAKELEVPVLLVQQLNRGVESRSDKHPRLGDLRDSGEHEQNADVVLGLYRDSLYKTFDANDPRDLELEVLGLKSREGPTAKVKLRYERHLHRFTEFT